MTPLPEERGALEGADRVWTRMISRAVFLSSKYVLGVCSVAGTGLGMGDTRTQVCRQRDIKHMGLPESLSNCTPAAASHSSSIKDLHPSVAHEFPPTSWPRSHPFLLTDLISAPHPCHSRPQGLCTCCSRCLVGPPWAPTLISSSFFFFFKIEFICAVNNTNVAMKTEHDI